MKHEFEHHVPALGNPEIRVRYGVKFTEEEDTSKGFIPFISLSGKVRVKVYKASITAVEEPSVTDKIRGKPSR